MELTKNQYQINGIPVVSLAEKHGSPLYIYDSSIMIRQYKRITEAVRHSPTSMS